MKLNEYDDRDTLTREEQKEEAVKQMKALGLKQETIQQFISCGTVYKSVHGKLLPLTPSEEGAIQRWEKKTDALVYHIIFNTMTSEGLTYCFLNMLYVEPHKEGYEAELAIISEYAGEGAVMVFAYCINLDIPELSEYGLITVVNEKGILDRIG